MLRRRCQPGAYDLSIILPVFNKAPYLQQCLDTINDQVGFDLELICVDDCSVDGCTEILEDFCLRTSGAKLLKNRENRGAAFSRNLGLEHSSGRFVQFVDADDLLPPSSCSWMLEVADRTGSDVIRGEVYSLDGNRSVHSAGDPVAQETTGTILELPQIWTPWFHQSYIISQRLLRAEKLRYPSLTAGEDVVFIAAVNSCASRISLVPFSSYIYRSVARRRPSFVTVRDYIHHARAVKLIYGQRYATCWEHYKPLVRPDIALLLSQAEITADELTVLDSLQYDLWQRECKHPVGTAFAA